MARRGGRLQVPHALEAQVQGGRSSLLAAGGRRPDDPDEIQRPGQRLRNRRGGSRSGAEADRQRGHVSAAPVYGDSEIYAAADNGKIVVMANGPEYQEPIAINDMGESCVACRRSWMADCTSARGTICIALRKRTEWKVDGPPNDNVSRGGDLLVTGADEKRLTTNHTNQTNSRRGRVVADVIYKDESYGSSERTSRSITTRAAAFRNRFIKNVWRLSLACVNCRASLKPNFN